MSNQRSPLRSVLSRHHRRPPAGEQTAALCYRTGKDGTEVLIITSRETQRWVIPKGWSKKKLSAADMAEREAWEEAGVKGKIARKSIGSYTYDKRMDDGKTVLCETKVFPLHVKEMVKKYPESGQRKLKWVTPKEAAKAVDEPELKALIAGFAPS